MFKLEVKFVNLAQICPFSNRVMDNENEAQPQREINNVNVNMFSHPWVVKIIKQRIIFSPPFENARVSLFVFGPSIIAGGQCNCGEPIFRFSTSTVLEKQSRVSHGAPVYCSTRSVLFQMMWSETQNNVQLCSKAKSGRSCWIILSNHFV